MGNHDGARFRTQCFLKLSDINLKCRQRDIQEDWNQAVLNESD